MNLFSSADLKNKKAGKARSQHSASQALLGVYWLVLCQLDRNQNHHSGSKPVCSTLLWPLQQLLLRGSWTVWVPLLTCFNDEQHYRCVGKMNHFLPNLLFFFRLWCFIAAIIILTKTKGEAKTWETPPGWNQHKMVWSFVVLKFFVFVWVVLVSTLFLGFILRTVSSQQAKTLFVSVLPLPHLVISCRALLTPSLVW